MAGIIVTFLGFMVFMAFYFIDESNMAILSSILDWRISMDRGAWRATVHGVKKSQTRLRD